MSDVTAALQAKSDQLNAVDIMSGPLVIKIRKVNVGNGDQPIKVFFEGDNNRPWTPSKGMTRFLAGAWGNESDKWIGKKAELFFEPAVLYAGKPVGGIRIRALSDIDPKGMKFTLVISKQKRIPYPIPLLIVKETPYPNDKFDQVFDVMVENMNNGKMTLQGVISQCQKTGELSEEQLARLEASAPVDDNEHTSEEP